MVPLWRSAEPRRHQDLPTLDFQHFDAAFARLRSAREALGNHVKNCENLHENIDRQLRDLQTARPKVEPHIYKEKLLAAESLYAEVKAQREQFASAEAEAKEKTQKAEACSSKLKTLNEELRRYDQELHEMRTQRRDKESKAATLRSKANLPGLEDRKRQIADDIKNNLDEAKLLQAAEGSHLDWRLPGFPKQIRNILDVEAQAARVNVGEPGYLNEGQSREQKISEITAKLNELKRYHQTLLQKQKEFDIDPVALGNEATQLEGEASRLDESIGDLEAEMMLGLLG
eukprot:symbB.v1.2.037650.t2/scaffold5618.1/size25298/2